MSEPFLGEIRMFAGSYAPERWAYCDGQLLPISGHEALYSLLGTAFGGDGRTTFGLPDLRGRVPMHPGNGPGLSHHVRGQMGGQEQVALQQTDVGPGGRSPIQVNTGAHTNLPNMQPYTCVNFIIALEGLYPPRN